MTVGAQHPDQLLRRTSAVVLAGGLGTRVRHLLPGLPKPMAPVLGRPFLEWVVRYVHRQGISDAVISTGYLAEVVEGHFASNLVPGISVSCVVEEQPLGTAGGFLNAVRRSQRNSDGWLILNGDSLVLADLALLVDALSHPRVQGALLGVRVDDASRYGRLVSDGSGLLTRFEEKRPGSGVINAGVYLLRSALLESFPKLEVLSFEKDVFPELIQRGTLIRICETKAPFLDIGTPDSLPLAETFIRDHADWFAPPTA